MARAHAPVASHWRMVSANVLAASPCITTSASVHRASHWLVVNARVRTIWCMRTVRACALEGKRKSLLACVRVLAASHLKTEPAPVHQSSLWLTACVTAQQAKLTKTVLARALEGKRRPPLASVSVLAASPFITMSASVQRDSHLLVVNAPAQAVWCMRTARADALEDRRKPPLVCVSVPAVSHSRMESARVPEGSPL